MKASISEIAMKILSDEKASDQLMNFLVSKTKLGTPHESPIIKVKINEGKVVEVQPSLIEVPAAVSK